jgi:hypothetical protein
MGEHDAFWCAGSAAAGQNQGIAGFHSAPLSQFGFLAIGGADVSRSDRSENCSARWWWESLVEDEYGITSFPDLG